MVLWDVDHPSPQDSERYQAAQQPVRDHTDYARAMNYMKHCVGPFKIVHSKLTSLEIMLGAGQAGAGKAKEVVLKNGQKLTVEVVSHFGYGVLGNQLVI